MKLTRVRLKKEYRLKVWTFLISVFLIFFLFIPRGNRAMLFTFFNTKCRSYHQVVYSKKLSDRLVDYYELSQKNGIQACKNFGDIQKLIIQRKLFKARSNRLFVVADMKDSYPYSTRASRKLLRDIGRRFDKKITEYGLQGSRFIVTSMTRTTDNVRDLKKINGNVSDNSPHMNGNAFDISYAHFSLKKLVVTSCDEWYLKEALAEVITEMRKEKRCWATYEKNQGCFHIVSRK